MLRHQLLRSVRGCSRFSRPNAATRTFSASTSRPAEVEITIGVHHPLPISTLQLTDNMCRWKESFNRRFEILHPLPFCRQPLTPYSWIRPHPSMRESRSYH